VNYEYLYYPFIWLIPLQRKLNFFTSGQIYTLRKMHLLKQKFLALYFLLTIFCLASLPGKAQKQEDHPEYQYLLKNNSEAKLRFSTFYGEIAPSTAWANLSDAFGKVFMTEFGMHLNRKFSIGFYLARSPKKNQVPVPAPGTPEYDDWINAGIRLDQLTPGTEVAFIYFSHSGVNLAYMHNADRVVFWRAGLRAGSGKLEIVENQRQLLDFFNTSIYEATAFNINPEVGIGVNLRSWWRLHADLGYRVVIANTKEPVHPTDFFGLTFKVGFAFGAFNR
jgi:hypothetical protein